jgi:DNA-binding beta-propeller fold protein YncE
VGARSWWRRAARPGTRRRGPGLAAALLATGTLAAVAAVIPAAHAGTGVAGGSVAASGVTRVPLPFPRFFNIAADAGRVYFATGPGTTEVVVTDHAGTVVGRVPGLPDARHLAVSPDRRTLYVSLRTSGEIAAISTATLREVARYRVGADTCPGQLVPVGDLLWFSHGCSQWRGNVGLVDLSDPAAPRATVDMGAVVNEPPLIAVSPAAPDVVFEATAGQWPSQVFRFERTGDTLVPGPESYLPGFYLRDMAVTPDGGRLVMALTGLAGHVVLDPRTLEEQDRYPSGWHPSEASVSPDGRLVAAGVDGTDAEPDLYLHDPAGGLPIADYTFDGDLAWNLGVAWAPDASRLFVVTTNLYGDEPALNIVPLG